MEGFFKNGDKWNGEIYLEGMNRYFIAIDANGNTYETHETPTRYPLFTMIRLENGIGQEEAQKQIDLIKGAA